MGWKIKPGQAIVHKKVLYKAGEVLDHVDEDLRHLVDWEGDSTPIPEEEEVKEEIKETPKRGRPKAK